MLDIYAVVSGSEPVSVIEALQKDERVHDCIIDADDAIDYIFFSGQRRLLVERKEIADLAHAFLTANEATGEPRLVAQMRQMAAEQSEDTRLVLLIEGHLSNHRGFLQIGRIVTGVRYNAIDNLLVAIQGWGIRVAHSSSPVWTPYRLLSLAENWLSDEAKSPIIMLPKAPRPQLRTLMTFPGLGPKRSKLVLDKMKNLRIALEAMVCEDTSNMLKLLDARTVAKVKAFLNADNGR